MANKVSNNLTKGIQTAYNITTNLARGLSATMNAWLNQMNMFMGRPIGLANPYTPNYAEMWNQLTRNIGNFNQVSQNVYGTPIGQLADPEYNSKFGSPWFVLDLNRNSSEYYDYLSYIGKTFYNGSKDIPNLTVNGIRETTPTDLLLSETSVGVISKIDKLHFGNSFSNDNVFISDINPNRVGSGLDTRLGVISNHYLNNMLQASMLTQEELGYSVWQKPDEDMTKGGTVRGNKGKKIRKKSPYITQGIYSKLGLEGEYGLIGSDKKDFLNVDETSLENGAFLNPNSYLVGDIIPWSVTDHLYDSTAINNDLDRVAKIQESVVKNDKGKVTLYYKDYTQKTDLISKYYPFGNYYSLTYSLGLVANSGGATQNYMAYSMLGYPLTQIKKDALSGQTVNITELLTNETFGGKIYTTVPDPKTGEEINIYEPYPRKYYVTNGSQGTNYLDQMTGLVHSFTKHGGDDNENIVRIDIVDPGNDNVWAAKTIYQHIEAEGNKIGSPLAEFDNQYKQGKVANSGVSFGSYKIYDADTIGARPDVIAKTDALFSTNKIKSIIGRFHTDQVSEDATDGRKNVDFISTAVSKYGMSRGRNLLRSDHGPSTNSMAGIGNGYDNPYCRVWTYHHQYHRLQDTIRPFEGSLVGTEVSRYRTPGEKEGLDGQSRLEKYGAKHKGSKLVSIAPVRNGSEALKDQLKHHMFSIENLAWKGKTELLTEDQKGPNGGRIMWFPPYNLTFNEATSVNWQETEFIGRGEPIPTYINTKRTGTLSFDILIDHPSIVNSFSGKEIGGNGVGDVDDTQSYEQQLLRFFAGCEKLSPTVPTIINQEPKTSPSKEEMPMIEVNETPNNEVLVLGFFAFFPNDYSGVDDRDKMGSTPTYYSDTQIPYPITYLLRGIGSGYESIYQSHEKEITPNDLRTAFIDLRTNIVGSTTNPYIAEGYEISNNNIGLSTIIGHVDYPNEFDNLMKVRSADIGDANYRCFISKSGKKKWAYRVDNVYQEENLIKNNGKNYVDNTSFALNAKGYEQALNHYSIADEEREKFVSLVDAFVGIECNGNPEDGDWEHYADIENIEKVQNAIETLREALANGSQIIVETSGYASIHGYDSNNKTLASNRCSTLENWLKTKDFLQGYQSRHKVMDAPDTEFEDVCEITAKLGRAACVKIYVVVEDVTDIPTDTQGNINIADNETEMAVEEAKNSVETIAQNNIEAIKNILAKANLQKYGGLMNIFDMAKAQAVENWARLKDQIAAEKKMKTDDKASFTQERKAVADGNGYHGNEDKFFEDLKRTDPFLHSKIMEKIRFFDPAFHSITPEGFQARLTFLNQCTRQGSTCAWSDNSNSLRDAANLAFGRPPVLVLRIGDFYNTKIIVTSLNIDFKNSSGMQWDLNDEGIGVMPMYATINMQIMFLGGSEMGGPIPALQNAMSFNYYANTSVYDNRAEQIEYGDGDGKYVKYKISPVNK